MAYDIHLDNLGHYHPCRECIPPLNDDDDEGDWSCPCSDDENCGNHGGDA